jgi:cytochrome c
MKLIKILAVATLLCASSAWASADLAKQKNCMACHGVDTKLVGPAFKAVADKNRKDPGAEARLATKIVKGGGGVWGPVPMPANANVSEAEAKALAKWVLSLK